MANIRKVPGKTGVSYKITVTHGVDMSGKQLRHYKTWTPPPGMTEKRAAKEAEKVAIEFEQQIEQGYALDNRQTFAEYARYAIDLKARSGVKYKTIELYNDMLGRIDAGIGHIRLAELKPQHLNDFYKNMAERGVRAGADVAAPSVDIKAILKSRKLSYTEVGKLAHVAANTVAQAAHGHKIRLSKAEAIASALKTDVHELFKVELGNTPLSQTTIARYHRLISTILTQAEKEMLVQFNAASKATPKPEKHEANYFQIEDVERIRDALETEPLKWKVITHLLLVTGCRRGEIMGLKWPKVDFSNHQIKIDEGLVMSRTRGVYSDTTKTSTTRFVKLPLETMTLLREYRKWYIGLQLANGDRWHDTGYLFVQDNGEPMNPGSITDWLDDFSKRHALPHINPHAFRHTHASILYFNGVDGIAISKRLGHAKVSTTTDIYSHIIKQADEKASECIADAILRKKKEKAQ